MIELVAAGRRPSEPARLFGCHENNILDWVRASKEAGDGPPSGSSSSAALNAAECQELVELRRKLRQVQQEHDIWAKATAWFANKTTTSTPFLR